MSIRSLYTLLALCVPLAALACHRAAQSRPGVQPKHVLMVTVGGLRADHLSGTYLYPRPTTAWQIEGAQRADGQALAIDDLCEQGVSFAWAYANAPSTRESLVALHSGYPAVVATSRKELPTLAEDFSRAGFKTAAFVAGRDLGDTQYVARGFASFNLKSSDAEVLEAARQSLLDVSWKNAEHVFVWVHLDGPEPPLDPTPLAPRQGDANGVTDYAQLFVDPKYDGSLTGSLDDLARVERGERPLSRADRDHLIDLYDGEVAKTASLLRSFFLFWRNSDADGKWWDETLVVLAGTNGLELYDRSQPQPRNGPWLGIERVRVPLVFRHPHSLTGSRLMAEPVDLADVAPTLREWFFGLETTAPPPMRGRSLLPLVDSYLKRPFDSRDEFAIDVEHRAAALRTPEWTLLSWSPPTDKQTYFRLFDRLHDPREEQDLSEQRPEVASELKKKLALRVAALKLP